MPGKPSEGEVFLNSFRAKTDFIKRANAENRPDLLLTAVQTRLQLQSGVHGAWWLGRITAESLSKVEAFRLRKFDPRNPIPWSHKAVGDAIADALRSDAEKLPIEPKMVACAPVFRSGACLSNRQMEIDLAKFRKQLEAMHEHPFFAHFVDATDMVFAEALHAAEHSSISEVGNSLNHSPESRAARGDVLASGRDQLGHLIDFLGHIERINGEALHLNKSKYAAEKLAFRAVFEGLAYATRGCPRNDLTFPDLWSGQDDLITAVYAFISPAFGLVDADLKEGFSVGVRAKNSWAKSIRDKLKDDFATN